MRYPFCLRTYNRLALLNTGASRSLVNTLFAWLVKLPLGPSWVQRIKVADECMVLVQHEILHFNITMKTLPSTLKAPVTDV